MATHEYFMEAVKRKKSKGDIPLSALSFYNKEYYFFLSFSDFFDFEEDDERVGESFSCRESMMDSLEDLDNLFTWSEATEYNVLIGIRCFGYQHNAVEKILRDYDDYSALESLLKKCFDIKVLIKSGRISLANWDDKGIGNYYFKYRLDGKSVKESINGFVSVYFPMDYYTSTSAIDVKISAIIALMKEPILVDGIMRGEITTPKALSRAILDIACKRAEGYHAGYYCPTLCGEDSDEDREGDALPSIHAQILTELSSDRFNDDGSDWASMIHLSAFVWGFGSKTLADGFGKITEHSGPVSFMVQYIQKKSFVESFRREVANETQAKIVAWAYRHDRTSESWGSSMKSTIEEAFS